MAGVAGFFAASLVGAAALAGAGAFTGAAPLPAAPVTGAASPAGAAATNLWAVVNADGSLARGSGVQPADVNRVLKAREAMQKLAKQIGRMPAGRGGGNNLAGLGRLLG